MCFPHLSQESYALAGHNWCTGIIQTHHTGGNHFQTAKKERKGTQKINPEAEGSDAYLWSPYSGFWGEWLARVSVQTGPQWKTLYQNKSKNQSQTNHSQNRLFKQKRHGQLWEPKGDPSAFTHYGCSHYLDWESKHRSSNPLFKKTFIIPLCPLAKVEISRCCSAVLSHEGRGKECLCLSRSSTVANSCLLPHQPCDWSCALSHCRWKTQRENPGSRWARFLAFSTWCFFLCFWRQGLWL